MLSGTFMNYHVLVLELFLDELTGVSKLWQLHLLCFHDERWDVPLVLLLVPICLGLELLDLVISHEVCNNLLEEVEFLGLLSHVVKKVFITICVLLMDVG